MIKTFFIFCIGMLFVVNPSFASKIVSPTSIVLMVPPNGFEYNPETAESNAYQHQLNNINVQKRALDEFYTMVARLRDHGITVIILQQDKALPDAVFPNNWFSTHQDKKGTTLILYPMLTENRKAEVNPDGILNVLDQSHISIDNVIDLRNTQGEVLEGTGSMVFDHNNRIIYASLSARTNKILINKVAKLLHYTPIIFTSVDEHNKSIYHTNVMMGIAEKYAVICLECIHDAKERATVTDNLRKTNKTIISITYKQLEHMCGNILELNNHHSKSILVMSQQAYEHFTEEQLKIMQRYSSILPMDLKTIETIGGGSARCMMAEIFANTPLS